MRITRESTTKNKVLTKQYRLPLLGEFRQLWGGVGYWYQFVILASSVTSAYYSSGVLGFKAVHFPWLNLPIFFLVLIVVSFMLMFFEYKFVQPSAAAYWNQLVYDHGNPMKADIVRVEGKVGAVETKIDAVGTKVDAQDVRLGAIEGMLKEFIESQKKNAK